VLPLLALDPSTSMEALLLRPAIEVYHLVPAAWALEELQAVLLLVPDFLFLEISVDAFGITRSSTLRVRRATFGFGPLVSCFALLAGFCRLPVTVLEVLRAGFLLFLLVLGVQVWVLGDPGEIGVTESIVPTVIGIHPRIRFDVFLASAGNETRRRAVSLVWSNHEGI